MGEGTSSIRVRVLGRVALDDAAADSMLGRGQVRELLAVLVARGRNPSSTADLIDALWVDEPPATAATIVHGHIRRLRAALGSSSVAHDVGGYRLDLPTDAVDLWLLDGAVRTGDHRRARALWAEPLFGAYASHDWARAVHAELHHLRGIAEDGPGRRPARRTLPASRLVGRRRELRTVLAAIDRSRLVSIVGLGGVGKSRLALEAMGTVDDSVHVDLGLAAGPVISRIAGDLGLTASGEPNWDRRTVASVIGGRDLVLLVDGCEHDLAGAAATIDELLTACPRLRVLATSRVALGGPGEHVVPLLPFADPADPHGDAVDLLLDRTTALGFPGHRNDRVRLAAVCARTAGVPLAIELSVTDAVLETRMGSNGTDPASGHPADALGQIVQSTVDGLTGGAATVVHRAARLVHGFTPALLASLTGPETSPLGVLHELHATGLTSSSTADPGRRLRLLDPVRRVLLDQPDDGALDAVTTAIGDTVGRVRPDLTRPIDLAAVGPAVAELPNAESLLAELVRVDRPAEALRLARAGADVWAEAGGWTRGNAAIGAVLATVRPSSVPEPPTSGSSDPEVAPVEPIDWAGAVWAKAIVSATYAASRSDYDLMAVAAEIASDADRALEAHLQFLLTLGAGYGGDVARSGVHLARLRELVEVLDSDYGRVMVAQIDALSLLVAGDAAAAGRALGAVGQRAESIGAIADAARMHRLGGLARRTAGDSTGALRCLQTAESLALEAGSVGTIATIRTDIVDLRHQEGDLDRDTIAEALDAVLGIGNLRAAGLLRLRLGVLDDEPSVIAAAALDLLESDRVWSAVALAELVTRLPRAHRLRRVAPAAALQLRQQWGSPLGAVEAASVERLGARASARPTPWTPDLEQDLRCLLQATATT